MISMDLLAFNIDESTPMYPKAEFDSNMGPDPQLV